jgi:dTDP-4-amino-4,6-dideoxygalactose transaminase
MADPHFTAEDRERIHREIDAILDGALSMGPNVRAFEAEFALLSSVRHAVALNSCTSALEIALAYGKVAGGEVIVPAQTFIATGMAVHLAGATPVFAEIAETTFCLDLADVRRRITPKTRAIILVHMAGLITPDVDEFRALCDEYGLLLIEDAAHAPGAVRGGRPAGSIGHVGCFSFFPTKVMTSGDGGMLTTNDDELAAFARSMQHRGREMKAPTERYALPGRNVRMTEMTALVGRVQLSHLAEFLERRRRITELYASGLSDDSRVRLITADERTASSCWKIPAILAPQFDRAEVTRQMSARGVTVDWAYQPALHLQPVFRELYGTHEGQLPTTEGMLSRHVCLPCHPRLSDAEAAHVVGSLRETLDSLGHAQ